MLRVGLENAARRIEHGIQVDDLDAVLAADFRARVVDAAAVVLLQVLAARIDAQIPLLLFDEDEDVLMDEIPADVIVLPAGFRGLDLEDEIAATQGGTLIAKTGTAHIGPTG